MTNDTGGIIERTDFVSAVVNIIRCDKLFAIRFAKLFDFNNDQKIDFAEFEAAMWVLTQGSKEERLRCIFDVYDADKSGTIDREELLLYCYIANRMKNKTEQKVPNTVQRLVVLKLTLVNSADSRGVETGGHQCFCND